jgi:hypothetical protein
MAAAENDAYELNATRSAANDPLHVADTLYHPLASSEDIRDHPMITAADEAYETNATRSATNNTVRVVNNSDRPFASWEDIRSRASLQSEADELPPTRESTSPAQRHDEMTADHDLNRFVPHKSSEELQRGKALERLLASYMRGALDSWFYEYVALVFSVGCLAVLVVVLGIYDGKETPQLPYNITLNALISILSTAAKSSLLFAVAGILGQIKWAWFTESRELSDMQTFDDATRGPWGALLLLCSRSIKPLASLGAVITILALAYGPFLQQLVSYPVFQVGNPSRQATAKKAVSLDATSNFTDWSTGKGAAWSDIRQYTLDPPICPTGDCTWPRFTSLEYCSKCSDTTSEASLDCMAVVKSWNGHSNETCEIHPRQGNPATVWQGREYSYSYSLKSIVWLVRESSRLGINPALMRRVGNITAYPGPNSSFQSGYSYLGVEDPMLVYAYALFNQQEGFINDTYSVYVPTLVKVETCVMTPCERTYQLSVTAGEPATVVVNTDYGASETIGEILEGPYRCWRPTSYRGTEPGQTFCTSTNATYSANVTDSIGLIGRESAGSGFFHGEFDTKVVQQAEVMELGFPIVKGDINDAIQAHNFSYLMERIAASMTKAEFDNSTSLVYGHMSTGLPHVHVAWHWFILPAALNVLAMLLLLGTVILSHHRKTQLWKSSTLALLYHGLDAPEPVSDLALADVSEMKRWASTTSAKLGSAKDGGRVILRTLPRDKTSQD